jgi:predicted DNA-binding transcriptional regulator AlpA
VISPVPPSGSAHGSGVIVAFPKRHGFEPWLSKKQVAVHYGFSTRWVELRVRDGMPSHLRGGQRRFLLSEIEAWFERRHA